MSRPRGAAVLGTIVALSSLLLLLMLGMATVAVMPLTLAHQALASAQAQMIAESAIEQARYEMLVAETSTPPVLNFADTPHLPLDVAARFTNSPIFPHGMWEDPSGNTTALMTFNQKDPRIPYYSVDNSISEQAVHGFVDGTGPGTGIPPFTIDFLVTVQNRQACVHYETMVSRLWNYAVYSTCGISFYEGMHVIGNAGTSAVSANGLPQGMNLIGADEDTGLPHTNLFGNAIFTFTPEEAAQFPQIVSTDLLRERGHVGIEGMELHDVISRAVTSKGVVAIPYPDSSGYKPWSVADVSTASTAMRSWDDVDAADSSTFDGLQDAPKISWGLQPDDTPASSNIRYLTQDLNVTGSSRTDSYIITSALANYLPATTGSPPVLNYAKPWQYSGAGIHLTSCTLVVQGDVDLMKPPGATGTSDITLSGDNATLIVQGSLRLTQGQLAASSAGMVIMADYISIEAGGTYDGLMVARKALRIHPNNDKDNLTIVGSVLAAGGDNVQIPAGFSSTGKVIYTSAAQSQPVIMAQTTVQFDPQYVKPLVGLGTLQTRLWRVVP